MADRSHPDETKLQYDGEILRLLQLVVSDDVYSLLKGDVDGSLLAGLMVRQSDGTFVRAAGNAEGAVLTSDFLIEVSKGNVPGHSLIHKFGRNPDIGTADGFEAIWNGGGSYTGFDAVAAQTVEVFSDDATDAGTVQSSGAATGGSTLTLVDTGADFVSDGVAVGDILINDTNSDHGIITVVTATTLTVMEMHDETTNVAGDTYRVATTASTGLAVARIDLALDGDYAEAREYIVLNGTTVVDTTTQFLRASRSHGVLAGTGGVNAGTITMRQKTTTANVFIQMPVGYNQTTIVAYTVPAGKKGYLLKWFASIAKKQAGFSDFRLLFAHFGEPLRVQEEYTVATTGSSMVTRQWLGPKDGIRPRTDIVVVADSSVDNNAVSSGFDILLVDI